MPQTRIITLPLRAPRGLFQRSLTALSVALTRRVERRRLADLDAHMLRDIGLDRADAQEECAKPFWRP